MQYYRNKKRKYRTAKQKIKRIKTIFTILLLFVIAIMYILSSHEILHPIVLDRGRENAFSFEDIPEYSGMPAHIINKNRPQFTDKEYRRGEKRFIQLSKLDFRGRCGTCMASFGPDTLTNESRESISNIYPTGLEQEIYDEIDNGGALYNRSHLLMYAMSGLGAEPRNLITGTRYMNSRGMLPYEMATMNWIKRYEERIIYRVTPIFIGRELVARGVHIEAADVKTKGEKFHVNVYCYNVQPGVKINYKTGHSSKDLQ